MSIVTVHETTTYTIDWAALAAGVEQLVRAKLAEDLENWKDDLSMRVMFVQDCADGLAVCETMLEKESWPAVENRLRNMDTAARDCIYEFIEQVAGAEFFDCVRV
jgi:hypothetical protein